MRHTESIIGRREEIKKLYETPDNKRLKYIALAVMGLGVAIMVGTISLLDHLSWTTLLVMRGCAGVCAIIFVILVAILVYRVNTAYHNRPPRR